ncbi:MAG TPA: hypothetical protein VGR15_09640 [Bacteroidota bacterium]|nr:hypothetical protein [Bacteroidota bacterium]
MPGIFNRILTAKIFTFFWYIILIALIIVYGFGTYHAYQHSLLLTFVSGFLVVPAFYYAYEGYTAEHHPCVVEGCSHLCIEAFDTKEGRLYICDEHVDLYKNRINR